MYEIYAYPYGNPDAKLLLYRPNDPQALVLSPKLTREVSKGGSLVFTMTRDHAQYDMLQKLSTVVQVRRDGKEIWRGRVLKHEADFYNRRVVYCEGALSYFNDSSITPFNYKGTLRQFLQHLIDAHNDQVKSKMKCFQLGTVTAALGNLVVQFGDADQYGVGEDYGKVWDILDKLVLKVFGGYFYCSFDSSTGLNVLNYCDQAVEAKRQTAQKIEYGRNLLNLSETTDATDLYTRMSKYHISTATIARTAVLLLALTNQVLSALGKPVLPIESATVEQLVTAGITTVAALISWWKNNSFTPAAIAADQYLERQRKNVY